MMLFLTFVFLIWYSVLLLKGNIFHNLGMEIGEEEIRKQRLGTDNYKADENLTIKILLISCFLIPMIVVLVIYLCVGIQYDPLKYPTLTLLVYYVGSLLLGVLKNKKKIDLSSEDKIEKYRKKLKKKRTVKGILLQLIWTTYFLYMAYNIVF
ncbi:hypothetical protein [Metabacillus fastidiosus]|uniref:hypothetical protein n=1 Tax=Metabacillus fastidiosus TaxID=1458 RepID=UPI003D2CD545